MPPRFLSALCLLVTTAVAADAPLPSTVASAHARFRLEPETPLPPQPAFGIVSIAPGDHPGTDTWHAAVFDGDGRRLPAVILPAAPGDMTRVLFDASAITGTCHLLLSATALPARPLPEAPRPLCLETRPWDGPMPESLDAWRRAWSPAGSPLGFSPVDSIFHAVSPHHATTRFLSRYAGSFRADLTGEYRFATISDDASFLLVDGRLTAQWPGEHGAGPGIHGEHSGVIHLTSGLHAIEYLHAQGEGALATVAAWQPPGHERLLLMPSNRFLHPVPFAPAAIETNGAGEPAAAMVWQPIEHLRDRDLTAVLVRFRAIIPDQASCRWSFTDGLQAEGPIVDHLFVRTGLTRVVLDVRYPDGRSRRLSASVAVRPVWDQAHDWHPSAFARARAELLERNWTIASRVSLADALRLAERADDPELLSVLGQACLQRYREFADEDSNLFLLLARHYQDARVRRYDLAERAFGYLLLFSPDKQPDLDLRRIEFALFLLHCTGKADVARGLLTAVRQESLAPEAAMRHRMARGDALLLQGRPTEAALAYQGLPPHHTPTRVEQAHRRSRLLAAAEQVRLERYDAADDLLNAIETTDPAQRLRLETGRLRLAVYRGRLEWPRALARALMMLALPQTPEAEAALLADQADILDALHRPAEAAAIRRRIRQEFPLTRPAASTP